MLAFACCLSACGFQPLYVQREKVGGWYFNSKFDTTILGEMKQVKVEPIADRFGQLIRNQLLDSLTPTGVPKKPKYRLFVTLKSREVYQQALREDITATREMIIFKVDYRMMKGSKQLFVGDSVAYVSYDILKNPYSTTIAQQKAELEAMGNGAIEGNEPLMDDQLEPGAEPDNLGEDEFDKSTDDTITE